jgi:hypothetical protein
MEFDLEDDNEPAQVVDFPATFGTDSRFFRAFAFKPTREGTFTLSIRAYIRGNLAARTDCPDVVVTP